MTEKTIHINAHLPVLSDWLNLNGSITMQLPYRNVRELAKKLAEVTDEDHVNLEFSFEKGKSVNLDFKFTNETKAKD
jgi:hypothetical protein